MNKRLRLIAALMVFLAITGGWYAFTYLSAIATMDVTVLGTEIATAQNAPSQPDWDSIVTPVLDTETLRPNAVGTYSQCDAVGDAPNYLCVDEEVPDEDATYVRTWYSATELDTYNLTDHSEGAGTINSVTVYIRTRATSGTHDAEVAIRTYGTDYFGGYTSPVPTSYTNIPATWTTNPYTSTAWTWDEVDALQAGVRHYDLNGGYLLTTQVYVEVSYAVVPLCGDVPAGDLYDITPHSDYTGDLAVKVCLTNTGSLVKAYGYLNIKLYLEGSVEAGETPDYLLLTLEDGGVTFNLKNYDPGTYTLSVVGGSYCLVSTDTSEWEAGWTVTPEFYCIIIQR